MAAPSLQWLPSFLVLGGVGFAEWGVCLYGLYHHAGVEGLVSFHVCEGDHERAPREPRDAAEVVLGHAAAGDGAAVDKVLERHVVDALGAQDDVGARVQHHLDAPRRDVQLLLPDALQLARVRNEHLHAHLHLGLLQVEVDARDPGVVPQVAIESKASKV